MFLRTSMTQRCRVTPDARDSGGFTKTSVSEPLGGYSFSPQSKQARLWTSSNLPFSIEAVWSSQIGCILGICCASLCYVGARSSVRGRGVCKEGQRLVTLLRRFLNLLGVGLSFGMVKILLVQIRGIFCTPPPPPTLLYPPPPTLKIPF